MRLNIKKVSGKLSFPETFLGLCRFFDGVEIGHVIQRGLAAGKAVIRCESIIALSRRGRVELAVRDVAEAAAIDIEAAQRIRNLPAWWC